MFELRDLFQWERFITPSIIKIFYWLAVGLTLLAGLSGIVSGVGLLLYSPIAGFITVLVSILATLAGIIIARISAEFILIVFRINEHLGAIRNQRGM
jgi:hypothetical protein